jgi:hypothetical protein
VESGNRKHALVGDHYINDQMEGVFDSDRPRLDPKIYHNLTKQRKIVFTELLKLILISLMTLNDLK